MIVSLSDLKEHCRVDGDDQDALIATYGRAAERAVSQHLDRPIYAPGLMPAQSDPGYDRYQIEANEDIAVAIMQIVADMNDRRGTSGGADETAVIPQSARWLLAPYRVFFKAQS